MKYAEINKRFTELVTEYIAKGYILNTATMKGSQGEISKADLTDGKEIIRILIENFSDWKANIEGIQIIIGRATDDIKPNDIDTWNTIWNNRLEILHQERFYKIGADRRSGTYFGTEAEAEAARAIRIKRYRIKDDYITERKDITDKAMEVAMRIIKYKMGYTRINKSEVKVNKRGGKYTVYYRNKAYTLH